MKNEINELVVNPASDENVLSYKVGSRGVTKIEDRTDEDDLIGPDFFIYGERENDEDKLIARTMGVPVIISYK